MATHALPSSHILDDEMRTLRSARASQASLMRRFFDALLIAACAAHGARSTACSGRAR